MGWPNLPQAVEQRYAAPPDMGGLRANYPILDRSVAVAGGHADLVGWYGPTGVSPFSPVDNFGDEHAYANDWCELGDIWTIQLGMRPGYYVTPDELSHLDWGGNTIPDSADL